MRKTQLYILFVFICSIAFNSYAADTLKLFKKEILLGRVDRGILNYTVVPKGQVVLGLTASYTTFVNEDYELLTFFKDFDAEGYTFSFKPFVGYFYRDNSMVGARFGYTRTLLKLNNISLEFDDDMDFNLSNVYLLEQKYSGTGLIRNYFGLGGSKRFALFNETSITFSGGDAKFVRGQSETLNGTFSTIRELQVGVTPGLTAFITNNIGIEVSLGVAGFKYRKEKQVHNQVETGESRTSGINFKIDLFSIGIGLAVYL